LGLRDLTLLGNSWMQVGLNKRKYDYVAKRVLTSARDLVKKKLVPTYSLSYFTDPAMLKEGIDECFKGPFHEWNCQECGIRVYGPRKWIGFHLAIHGKFQNREGRGGEIYKLKFNLD